MRDLYSEILREILLEKDDRCTRIAKQKYDVWPSAYACVPENTSKALTKEGWKQVGELIAGDEIMTYNIEKDELEFKPILNIHRYCNAKTNVVKSGNNGFVFEATDNHKWVVKLPELKGQTLRKYERIHDKALIETCDLIKSKNNKHLVVSAQYNGGEKVELNKIFKYGTNWVKYILDITSEQRQSWLFSAIVYDGNQLKVQRLTENKRGISDLDWLYTSTNGKQSFGFKQKDIQHRDAFLLAAFLNSGMVTFKKCKQGDIYSCYYISNKRFKNTANFKIIKENVCDVWCPETENNTWVMMQETDGNGIITITGNSGAVVRCRKGDIWKDVKEDSSYRGAHQPISSEDFGARLDDLTNNGEFVPKDFYTMSKPYGSDGSQSSIESVKIIKSVKGKPDLDITIYRAVPKGIKTINTGDWVTLSPTYAKVHGDSNLKGDYDVISKKVKVKDVKWDGDSVNEFGYFPAQDIDEKSNFSKEKEQGLHGWFSRQGGEGKSKGWVDCNTCKKDPVTGKKKCKSCGRQAGEKRSKYPSCRPTPAQCDTPGKGKSWGKTKSR